MDRRCREEERKYQEETERQRKEQEMNDDILTVNTYRRDYIGQLYAICEGDIWKGDRVIFGQAIRYISRLPKDDYKSNCIGIAEEDGNHGDKIRFFHNVAKKYSEWKPDEQDGIQSRERVANMTITDNPDEDTQQETNLAIPGLEAMEKHIEILSKRKQLKEAQMIGLAKELFMLSAYKSEKNILVENCKFSVGFVCGDVTQPNAMLVSLYLKKITKKDKGKMTWRDLIPGSHNLPRPISRKPNDAIATFSVNKDWIVERKNISNKFLKLIPTGRTLVRERLDIEHLEALGDIAYLESMDEMAKETIDG